MKTYLLVLTPVASTALSSSRGKGPEKKIKGHQQEWDFDPEKGLDLYIWMYIVYRYQISKSIDPYMVI